MEAGAIVFLAVYVILCTSFVSFILYSQENEVIVGRIIVNSWRALVRLIKGERERERERKKGTRFETIDFYYNVYSNERENELFKEQDPNLLESIYPYYLDSIDKDRLKAMEAEFNNDCA